MLVFGFIGALIGGALMPAVAIVMGDIINLFNPSNTPDGC